MGSFTPDPVFDDLELRGLEGDVIDAASDLLVRLRPQHQDRACSPPPPLEECVDRLEAAFAALDAYGEDA